MRPTAMLDLICRYYDACSAADEDGIVATLAPDVTHYFLAPNPGSAPVSGARALARWWCKVQPRFDARWVVDLLVGNEDEAIIEWSLYWTPTPDLLTGDDSTLGTGEDVPRLVVRGAESYVFRDGAIAEIRAFYQQDPTRSTELEGFDYEANGYSRLGREFSDLHPTTAGSAA